MLENVPLTFTRISVKLRLPPKKTKEQESTTTASNLLPNDAPSFDLGLTPTPPDVNINADTCMSSMIECLPILLPQTLAMTYEY